MEMGHIHRSSNQQPLTSTKFDTPVSRGQAIVCLVLCSLVQVTLIILWLVILQQFRGPRGSPYGKLNQLQETWLRKSSYGSNNKKADGDQIFFYRSSTTRNIVTRLDFLVDLVHLVNNFEEFMAARARLHQGDKHKVQGIVEERQR